MTSVPCNTSTLFTHDRIKPMKALFETLQTRQERNAVRAAYGVPIVLVPDWNDPHTCFNIYTEDGDYRGDIYEDDGWKIVGPNGTFFDGIFPTVYSAIIGVLTINPD